MAFVTRCPYCGAVWLLPDKDTAERGPVRCSSCNHSFDATRALLCVDDSALPNLPKSTLPKAVGVDDALIKPAANPAEVESFAPSFLQKRTAESELANSLESVVKPVQNSVEKTITVEKELAQELAQSETIPAVPATARKTHEAAQQTHLEPDNSLIHVKRTNEPKLSAVSGALQDSFPGKTEPSLHIPADIAQKKEPVLAGVTPVTVKPKNIGKPESLEHIIPANDPDTEVKVVMAPEAKDVRPRTKSSRSYTGIVSVLLAIVLLVTLVFVSAVVFNQKIIEAFPQTQETFTKLCGKVPCPGFFMAQPEAFVVSKTTLRPVDESGNYTLDVTLINGSNFAQAVPWLELEFLDDNNDSIMKRSITPQDYLSDPQTTKSIPPNRPLTIRVSLQTNVTSARCVVRPTYPKNK